MNTIPHRIEPRLIRKSVMTTILHRIELRLRSKSTVPSDVT